jgi:hypothetical protein
MLSKEQEQRHKQQLLQKLREKYPAEDYEVIFAHNESAVFHHIQKWIVNLIGRERAFYLNHSKFREKLDTQPSYNPENIKTAIVKVSIYRKDDYTTYNYYETHYGIIDKRVVQKLFNEIKEMTLQEYLIDLSKRFTNLSAHELYTGYDLPFLILPGGYEFYSYRVYPTPEDKIRTKTFSLDIKSGRRLSFTVKQGEKAWYVAITRTKSEMLKDRYQFEWHSEKVYWPVIVFDVGLEIPMDVWNTIIMLVADLLKQDVISSTGERYRIPVIAFEIQRNLFLMGRLHLTKKVLSDSISWRDGVVYLPKNKEKLQNFIKEALSILDQRNIEFIPRITKNFGGIIFAFGTRGLAAGSVQTDIIGGKVFIFIDLEKYTGIELSVVMHELLHYVSPIVNAVPVIRESFTNLATYLVLPEEYWTKFQEQVRKAERKVSLWSLSSYHYTVFPMFLYQKFVKGREQLFLDIFSSPTLDILHDRLPELFKEKYFAEELQYLIKYRDEEKYSIHSSVEDDVWHLVNKEPANAVTLLLALWYNKEEFTENFHYRINWLTASALSLIHKETGYTKFISRKELLAKMPDHLKHILTSTKIANNLKHTFYFSYKPKGAKEK